MSTIAEVLAALAAGTITQEEAQAQITALTNPAKKPKGPSLEISDKGGIKVKGIRQRWPIVFYLNEVQGMVDAGYFVVGPNLQAFIDANKEKLSAAPPEKEAATPAEGEQQAA